MKALILVDLQNDFMPGGSMHVQKGDEIIPLINEMIHYPFDLVIASKDWHPHDHVSFAVNHAGKKVGDIIRVGNFDQILWPVHCVQGTWGAEFTQGLDTTGIDKIIYKGTDPLIDSYSTFYDNGHLKTTGLENYLREKGVKEIFIAGLITEFCVTYSVFDALELGFSPYVVLDACRGGNFKPHDVENAVAKMQKGGATILSIKDLKEVLEDRKNRI